MAIPDAVALARLETDMMGKVMALASDPKNLLAVARVGPPARAQPHVKTRT